MTMTNPELEVLREKLIQTALTIAFAIEDIDKILYSTGPELNPPKPVRWGKVDPAEYGTLTTLRVDQIAGYPEVLVQRAAARLAGGAPMPLVVDKDGNVVDDGLDDDRDWVDPEEGRFDRQD